MRQHPEHCDTATAALDALAETGSHVGIEKASRDDPKGDR